MMKGIMLLVFSLFCLSPLGRADAGLRVMTYNIHHGEGTDGHLDLDRIADVIAAARPDVVCLQEVDRNLPRTDKMDFPAWLAQKLNMVVVFEPNYQFDGGDYGNAILTRCEVVDHANVPLPGPPGQEPRGCLRTTLRVDGRLVDVLNTHLGLNAQERKAQAAAIVDLLREGPTVLAGDLNENETGPALDVLLGRLRNTQTGEAGTARFTSPSASPRVTIDFVLVSQGVDVLSSSVFVTPETSVASDHLPYVADLALRPPRDEAEEEGVHDNEDERVTEAIEEGT